MYTSNQQFLSMALAYIEIGRVAAEAETELKYDSNYNNAVAYQLFHALELFYKMMIEIKKGEFNHHHDMRKLEEDYTKLYPSNNNKINHPFNFSVYSSFVLNEGEDKLFEDHLNKFKPKYMDQHLRYPIDERTGGYSFSLDSSVFANIKNEMVLAYSNCG